VSRYSVVLYWFCFLISACDQIYNNDPELKRRLSKAESDLAALQQQVSAFKGKQEWDDLMKDLDKVAYLKPGDEGYSTVGFDLGVLTVQLTDVKPYANGTKVTLKFGNTLSSSIDGLKATIEWGKVRDNGVADNSSAKSKEMTFSQTLPAGAWTSIPIVLDGIPPAELGFVRISKIHHTGIRLAAPTSR
jgi:hypothetical protein